MKLISHTSRVNCASFAISKFRFKKDNSFYPLLLLLLGDISLNPGPFGNPLLFKQDELQAFINTGLHSLNSLNSLFVSILKINSLLQKIDQLRDLSKRTKAAMVGILEHKLNSTVLDPEIYIENYEILRYGRNRHGRSVACCIRNNISYKLNLFLPNEIQNISFDILMPHTKPITVKNYLQTSKLVYFLIFLKKI